jgi:dynein heavy chain, axonemal
MRPSVYQRFPSDDCRNLAAPLVKATIAIFGTILADLRPTPAKSHYTYNLRDLSKVGILRSIYIKQPPSMCYLRLFELT